MAEYPEHEKLTKVKDRSQLLGEFIDWLSQHGYAICELHEGRIEDRYYHSGKTVQQWLADYFEIDLEKLETEKRQMLDNLRAMQKGGK